MAYRVSQANFSRGEIAEELIARIDVASYNTALKRAANVTILKYGGVTKRPGTRLVAEVYKDEGVRLIPFQYSLELSYMLEMGQGYARIASRGGLVLEEKLTITAVGRGVTTLISAAHHGYVVGDQVYFAGVAGCTDLNGKVGRVIDVPNDGQFRVAIDSTNFAAFTGDTGGITRDTTPVPPTPPVVPPPADASPPPETGGYDGSDPFFNDQYFNKQGYY